MSFLLKYFQLTKPADFQWYNEVIFRLCYVDVTAMIKRKAINNEAAKRNTNSVALALLTTVLLIVWAIVPRWLEGSGSIRETGVVEFNVNVWEVTAVLPSITIPIVLFYMFALTPPFRRFLSGKEKKVPDPQFVAGIGVVYLLSMVWFFFQREWPVELILFPLILCGLLAGRWIGLGLGLLTTVILAIYLLIDNGFLEAYPQLIPALYENEGWGAVLKLLGLDFYWLFLTAEQAIYLWTGLMAGLAAMWLGARRFSPFAALVVGSLVAYPSLAIPTLGHPIPGIIVPHLMGQAIAIGVGMAIAFLIVGSVETTMAVRKAESAEIDRMRAELTALRAQINPHFFFNALNTIRYFVRSDPEKARSLLLDLSDIFQRILRSGDFVSLGDEIAHVEAYLNLEKARLGERLHYEKEIADEALLETAVPTLILQPLVENAVIHGFAKKRSGGTIHLKLQPSGPDVVVEISDDGVGMNSKRLGEIFNNEARATSIGLRNVNQRLQALHGPAYCLTITSKPGNGMRVVVRLPLTGE